MATSVPEMTKRGSFNALGAAIQQVSGGIASVIAGHIVTMAPDGKLEQFPVVGLRRGVRHTDGDGHHVEDEARHRAPRGDVAAGCGVAIPGSQP